LNFTNQNHLIHAVVLWEHALFNIRQAIRGSLVMTMESKPEMGFHESLIRTLISGLLVVAPIYLAVLLLLKAMSSLIGLVRPIAKMLPDWLPAEEILSLLLVLIGCFLIGAAIRTRIGRATWDVIERSLFQRLPMYASLRSLTQQLAGESRDHAWKPALVELEEALVPAFIIEEFEDGRSTVFVPSVPTPLAGAIYILTPDRVHPVNLPFTQAIKSISHWGAGSKDLVAAMQKTQEEENRAHQVL
jgi:uncharacterized membrane protein